jgi:hypothetical protein
MGDRSAYLRFLVHARRTAAVAVGGRGRRAAGVPERGGERVGVRGTLRAVSPAAVPVLPLDRAHRRRCSGCAAVRVRQRVYGAEAWSARRAVASVAVPDRAQRGRVAASPTPAGGRIVGGVGVLDGVGRGAGRRASAASAAAGGPARVARASARGSGDARAQRPLARGDRNRARNIGRGGETDDFRGSPLIVGVRGGTRNGV